MARTSPMLRNLVASKIGNTKSRMDSFENEKLVHESPDLSTTTSLEEGLLARSEAYRKVYQAILDKYDRKFYGKGGGDSYDFNDAETFEAELKKPSKDIQDKPLPFSCDYDFSLDKDETDKLSEKISAAKVLFNWDTEAEKYHLKVTKDQRVLSSDEEGEVLGGKACRKRKSRKRKRSCVDVSSTPFRNFCASTLLIDSSYQTSDSEADCLLPPPPPPRLPTKRNWKEELESGYYDTDVPCSSKATTVKSMPATPRGDRASLSGGSVELDSSFYDSDYPSTCNT